MWGMRRRLGRRSKVRATEARVACVTQQNILFWKAAARQNNLNGRLSPFGLGRASLVRRRGYFCSVRKSGSILLDGSLSANGPSRHLLRLHKGGRYRGEPDIDEDL